MKKFFSLIAAVLFAGSMMAEPIVLDYSAKGYENQTALDNVAVTEGVITVTLAKGTGKTAPAYYTAGTGARTYGGNTMTIAASEGAITAIQFNLTQNALDYEVDAGTYLKDDAQWTGSASQIVFKTQGTSGHNRIKSITVYLDGETPVAKENIKANVAEAIAAGMALDSMATSDDVYEVTGYVVNAEPYSYSHKNQIWYMADDAENTAKQEFQAYGCLVYENEEAMVALDGDKVTLVGHLVKYYNKDEAKYVIEISNGKAQFVEKIDADHTIPEQVLDTITVAEALAIGKALPAAKSNNKKSDELVVKGFVVKAYAANEGFTDQNFYMADEPDAYGEFEAYRCTPDYTVVDGDYVYVRGQIVNFGDESKSTIEISNGTAVHGEAPKLDTIEVDVTAALGIGNALVLPEGETNVYAEGTYRVTGWVVSIPTGGSYDPEEGIESFYLSDDKTATRGDFLASQVSIDLEAQIGQQVAVVGRIQKHKSQSGNVSVQIFKGKATNLTRTGIENITLTEKAQKVVVDGVIYIVRDNKMFNLQGAQVR